MFSSKRASCRRQLTVVGLCVLSGLVPEKDWTSEKRKKLVRHSRTHKDEFHLKWFCGLRKAWEQWGTRYVCSDAKTTETTETIETTACQLHMLCSPAFICKRKCSVEVLVCLRDLVFPRKPKHWKEKNERNQRSNCCIWRNCWSRLNCSIKLQW